MRVAAIAHLKSNQYLEVKVQIMLTAGTNLS